MGCPCQRGSQPLFDVLQSVCQVQPFFYFSGLRLQRSVGREACKLLDGMEETHRQRSKNLLVNLWFDS